MKPLLPISENGGAWRQTLPSLGYLMLMLPAILAYDRGALNSFFEPKWFVSSVCLTLMLSLGVFWKSQQGVSRLAFWWLGLLASLLAWEGISLTWLPLASMGMDRWCQWGILAGYGLAGVLLATRIRPLILVMVLCSFAAMEAGSGLIQIIRFSDDLPRALIGTAGYHTFLADVLVALLPFAVVLVGERSFPLKLFAAFTAAGVFIVLIFCQSRAAFLGIALESIVWLFVARSRPFIKKRLLLVALVSLGILLLPLCSALVFRSSAGLGGRTHEDLSGHLAGRKLIWLSSLSMASASPVLGVGIGGYPFFYYDHQGKILATHPVSAWFPAREVVLAAHNELLHMQCETGLVGLLLLFALLLLPVAALVRQRLDPGCKDTLRLPLLASILGMMPSFLLSFPLHVPLTGILSLFLMGIAIGQVPISAPELSLRKPLALALPVLIAISFVLGAAYGVCRLLNTGLQLEETKPSESFACYKKALTLSADKGTVCGIYGAFAMRQGEPELGRGLLLQALATLKDTYIYENLGRIYQREKRYKESLDMFERARTGGISYIQDTCDMGIVLDLMGDHEQANLVLSEVVRLFPSNCKANTTLARLAISHKEFQLALVDLDRAACKRDAEYHLLRGMSLIALGQFSDGEQELYACLQTQPHNIEAMNNLAIGFALSSRVQLALNMYQQVLQIDPNNQIALVNRKRLEEAPQP